MFDESDLIHSYSRAQAIADGVLIDVSPTAKVYWLSVNWKRRVASLAAGLG
jgi:hypothetical protein